MSMWAQEVPGEMNSAKNSAAVMAPPGRPGGEQAAEAGVYMWEWRAEASGL
jgi:hypothetical protein